jgi:hypothetical protein
MDVETLKEISYNQCIGNLKKKINIFPKSTTDKQKVEKLNILLNYAILQELYEDCGFLKTYIESVINPKK